ncbi:MAG: aldehyde reductase [Deltaproteobacteria bacterium]|nr:MAG: aldehyde reductase [Deltaproteobacteria bacterium]
MNLDIDTSKPVLVTGATGYVAGWVVKRLLDAGATVHATVRDASRTERLGYLSALADESPGSIRFFSADLLEDGSFDEAMAGCGVVFHIASPYQLSVKDAQRELVDPAVNGTRNVLDAANRTPSVSRVVITSSCAAIYGDSADLQDTPNGVFTEEVWNTSSTLDHNPYSLSKTLAEKAAWKMAEAQDRWQLVVVNPSGVFGPGVRVHQGAESFEILKQLGDGTMASGVPDLGMGMVDVRDLADAHLAAGFLPDAEGRHIISGHNTTFPEVSRILREAFPGHPLPRRTAPKFLIWLVGPFLNAGITRRFVSRNVGLPWKADHSKSVEKLGVSYRPLSETLVEHFQQLLDEGELPGRKVA